MPDETILAKAKPRPTNHTRALARRAARRKWHYYCNMSRRWSAGAQLRYLQGVVDYCQQEGIAVPICVRVWLRMLELAGTRSEEKRVSVKGEQANVESNG